MVIYEHPAVKIVYNHSPAQFQSLMFSAYGLLKMHSRTTSTFKKWYLALEKTQWFSVNELKELQTKKLRLLIKHAYENVPYYHKKFREVGIKPGDIKQLDDLSKIPILTKEDIAENYEQLMARNTKNFNPDVKHTGGTTGTPLKFLVDKEAYLAAQAELWRHLHWNGYSFRDKVAVLRGNVIIPRAALSNHPWRYDIIQNHLYLSSYHLTEEVLMEYVKKLKKWQPMYLQAYPSSAYVLAKYLVYIGETISLKGIFTSSETVLPNYKKLFNQAFECDAIDYYGYGEPGPNIGQCPEKSYHISAELSIVEIIRDDDIADYGEIGHITATSLINYSMPFIRYKVGDIGSLLDEVCLCGRGLPLMKSIEGRSEDFVVTSEGRFIPPAGLTLTYEYLTSIKQCQFIQNSLDELTVKIIKKDTYEEKDTKEFLKALRDKLGSEIDISFEFVEDIPLTKSGKFRFVISKVPIKFK